MKIAPIKVDYVDHMGSDLSVVKAARVSFDKQSEWQWTPAMHRGDTQQAFLSEADTKLIAYLAKHNHWSPFAHTSIQLRIKAPIFVARQLVKHQVGGVWNEVSRRYVDSEPEFYFPEVWRGRPTDGAKQGSAGAINFIDTNLRNHIQDSLDWYEDMIDGGVAPEQARMILPQNMMTEWYWTGSLMFFARVCKERLAPGAQAETRDVANLIAREVELLFPVSWNALMGGVG